MTQTTASDIILTDQTRVSCLTCAQGKQNKNRQSTQDTGARYPIKRADEVISSDHKVPMTPGERLKNRCMVMVHKSDNVKTFLAHTKDKAAKSF